MGFIVHGWPVQREAKHAFSSAFAAGCMAIMVLSHWPSRSMKSIRPETARDAGRPAIVASARLVALVLGGLPGLCAAQLSPIAKQEIQGLLHAVGSSGCEFIRGGTPHAAAKAQSHLFLKYEYLEARDQLKSAEDFIVKAATRSSMTGEAYAIRCAGAGQMASEDWMKAKLKAMRQAPNAPAPAPSQPKR